MRRAFAPQRHIVEHRATSHACAQHRGQNVEGYMWRLQELAPLAFDAAPPVSIRLYTVQQFGQGLLLDEVREKKVTESRPKSPEEALQVAKTKESVLKLHRSQPETQWSCAVSPSVEPTPPIQQNTKAPCIGSGDHNSLLDLPPNPNILRENKDQRRVGRILVLQGKERCLDKEGIAMQKQLRTALVQWGSGVVVKITRRRERPSKRKVVDRDSTALLLS